MKGKGAFSQAEAQRARELLGKIRVAGRDEQKQLRHRLRSDIGFYISDFTRSSTGFTVADFDSLVERGTINIV